MDLIPDNYSEMDIDDTSPAKEPPTDRELEIEAKLNDCEDRIEQAAIAIAKTRECLLALVSSLLETAQQSDEDMTNCILQDLRDAMRVHDFLRDIGEILEVTK